MIAIGHKWDFNFSTTLPNKGHDELQRTFFSRWCRSPPLISNSLVQRCDGAPRRCGNDPLTTKENMASEIEEYQTALSAHQASIQKCEKNAAIVHHASNVLNKWRTAMVSNTDAGFPAELALSGNTPTIDAAQWPTARQIGVDMAAFHSTKSDARQAHSRIPESQRSVVLPPP
jgi:hypothetical protein